MSDIMRAVSFAKLLDWIFNEYEANETIFGIPKEKFFQKEKSQTQTEIFGESIETMLGPAAGPNTQLAQNIAAAYLTGSRFFELKTVQILDRLEFPKPCIKAEDECYNTEWSTELSIEGALDEYVKAWFLLYVLQKEIFGKDERAFIFNMSVGYDLEGIKSPKVDGFIEGMKDASGTNVFQACKSELVGRLDKFQHIDRQFIDNISFNICNSVTLSTMHGCPPQEIEAISKYLLSEKKLHTFVKMNPTLLGYAFVRNTFDSMGYNYIQLKEESFTHDLQYSDGAAMLKRLGTTAGVHGKSFGVKLSNTLPVTITKNELPGDEMYMSGRSLYPLTINLALKLAKELDGKLNISYSGGADFFNIDRIFETGIQPITVATTLLKPGGYQRMKQMAEKLEYCTEKNEFGTIDLEKLSKLAASAVEDPNHVKEKRTVSNRKIGRKLLLIDCFTAPCTVGCPIEQDVPEYLRLVEEEKYLEAYEVIVSKNPLPFITGTICNHRCMTKCTRLDYDESVMIREIKRLAAEKGSEVYLQSLQRSSLKSASKAAVVGAGPSGLAAAYFLARAGLDVTVFDKNEKPGGTVEYVIPDFRISDTAIEKDLELIKKTGVKFKLGVNPDFSVEKLQEEGFQYIYLAIGATKSNPLQLEIGSNHTRDAVSFLRQLKHHRESVSLGKNVAVIGAGNSAMDAARAARQVEGVENVYIIYRRTKEFMPADAEELEAALNEGVKFKELLNPVSFADGLLKCEKMQLGAADASGRRRPAALEGEFEEISISTVLTALGEKVDYELLKRNGLEIEDDGTIAVNAVTLETNVKHVFLGGDALLGPSTVVEAMAHGKKAAEAIIAKEGLTSPIISQDFQVDAIERLSEINSKKGILKAAAASEEEASRCLECGSICNICVEVCPNRANVAVKVMGDSFKSFNQVLHLDGICNECGNCGAFCPYEGEPYKDKFTLFWNQKDFSNSENNGFFLMQGGENPVFKVRFNDNTFELKPKSKKAASEFKANIKEFVLKVYQHYGYLF